MSEIDTLTPASRIPVLTERRPEPRAQPALCQGWLCNVLSDSYGSAPSPGATRSASLGSIGGCPIHSWY